MLIITERYRVLYSYHEFYMTLFITISFFYHFLPTPARLTNLPGVARFGRVAAESSAEASESSAGTLESSGEPLKSSAGALESSGEPLKSSDDWL